MLPLLLLSALAPLAALDDGLARAPPLGWRTWNAFELDVNQDLLLATADVLVSKKLASASHGGLPVSLAQAGYRDLGLDDGWQACLSGPDHVPASTTRAGENYYYNDHALLDDGFRPGVFSGGRTGRSGKKFRFHSEAGEPVVNATRFPNMRAMIEGMHARNLTAGFYLNNCWCQERVGQGAADTERQMRGDAALAMGAG